MKISNFFSSINHDEISYDLSDRLITLSLIAAEVVAAKSLSLHLNTSAAVSSDKLYDALEKGILYRGMLKNDLLNKPLWDQITLILDIFSELNEQLDLLPTPISILRLSLSDIFHSLYAIILRHCKQNDENVTLCPVLLVSFEKGKQLFCLSNVGPNTASIYHLSRSGDVLMKNKDFNDVCDYMKSCMLSIESDMDFDKIKTSSHEVELIFLTAKPQDDESTIKYYVAKDLELQVMRKYEMAHRVEYYQGKVISMARSFKQQQQISLNAPPSLADASIRLDNSNKSDQDQLIFAESTSTISDASSQGDLVELAYDPVSDQQKNSSVEPDHSNERLKGDIAHRKVADTIPPLTMPSLSDEIVEDTEAEIASRVPIVDVLVSIQSNTRTSTNTYPIQPDHVMPIEQVITSTQPLLRSSIVHHTSLSPERNNHHQAIESRVSDKDIQLKVNILNSRYEDQDDIHDQRKEYHSPISDPPKQHIQPSASSVENFSLLNTRFNQVFSNMHNLIQEYESKESKITQESINQSATIRSISLVPDNDTSCMLFDETIHNEDNDDVLQETVTHSHDVSILQKSYDKDRLPSLHTIDEEHDSTPSTRHSQVTQPAISTITQSIVDKIFSTAIHDLQTQSDININQPTITHQISFKSASSHVDGNIMTNPSRSRQSIDLVRPTPSHEVNSHHIMDPDASYTPIPIPMRSLSQVSTHVWPPAPLPSTESIISSARALIAEADHTLRESVIHDMLQSRTSEDLDAYSMRVFQAIKRNVIANADFSQFDSQDLQESMPDIDNENALKSSASLTHVSGMTQLPRPSASVTIRESISSEYPRLHMSTVDPVVEYNEVFAKRREDMRISNPQHSIDNHVIVEGIMDRRSILSRPSSAATHSDLESYPRPSIDNNALLSYQKDIVNLPSTAIIREMMQATRHQIEDDYHTLQMSKRINRRSQGKAILSSFKSSAISTNFVPVSMESPRLDVRPTSSQAKEQKIMPALTIKEIVREPVVMVFNPTDLKPSHTETRRASSAGRGKQTLDTPATVSITINRPSSPKPPNPTPPVLSGKKRASSAGRSGSSSSASSIMIRPSNIQQVKNALNNVCLAGSHHDAARQEALAIIDDCQLHGMELSTIKKKVPVSQYIIVLYLSKSLAFRGIYGICPFVEDFIRIYGRGPKSLPKDIFIESFMKYSSSSRSFQAIPTKTITSTTDAISIDPTKVKKQVGQFS